MNNDNRDMKNMNKFNKSLHKFIFKYKLKYIKSDLEKIKQMMGTSKIKRQKTKVQMDVVIQSYEAYNKLPNKIKNEMISKRIIQIENDKEFTLSNIIRYLRISVLVMFNLNNI